MWLFWNFFGDDDDDQTVTSAEDNNNNNEEELKNFSNWFFGNGSWNGRQFERRKRENVARAQENRKNDVVTCAMRAISLLVPVKEKYPNAHKKLKKVHGRKIREFEDKK